MLNKHKHKLLKYKKGLLNDHLVFKLEEIIEYCENFCNSE